MPDTEKPHGAQVLAAAVAYIEQGLAPVPLLPRSKKPVIEAWQTLRITAQDAPKFFNGGEVGIILGSASDRATDIDLDCAEAVTAAPFILPATATFGHGSTPRCHYIYKADLCETETRAWIKLKSADGFGILEIRIGAGRGAQTVFPPSTHISGEPIAWDNGAAGFTEIAGAELLARAHQLAAAAQLSRAYPNAGARHDAAFVLGGFLSKCKLAVPLATFMAAVAAASGQDADKRDDMIRTAEDGASADHPAGFPKLSETFGHGAAEKCAEWLDYSFAGTAPEGWPDPEPVPDTLLPVDECEPDYLPVSLSPWCEDIANRMQCPLDFVAVTAIIAAGSVIGRKVIIRPKRKDDWSEAPNLWGMIVGAPGCLKTPAMLEAMRPLKRLEIEAAKSNEEAAKAFEAEMDLYKQRKELAQKNMKKDLATAGHTCLASDYALEAPDEPKARRYIINDANYESLGEILSDNPNGVMAFRDELVSLLKNLDREEHASARGFYLSAWCGNGDDYKVDRIVRKNRTRSKLCLSLLGATQPGRLADYIRPALKGIDDGMTQRFSLLVWPDQKQEWHNVDEYPEHDPKAAAWETFQYLTNLKPEDVGAVTADEYASAPYLRFSEEAQTLFDAWRAEFEHRLLSDEWDPALKSHFGKYRKLVPSLALVNHLADRGTGPVSVRALTRALAMTTYLESHAKRAYAAADTRTTTAGAILQHVKKGDIRNGFTARDIYRKQWSGLSNSEQVQDGLDMLEAHNWIKCAKQETEGRPRTVYHINPKALP